MNPGYTMNNKCWPGLGKVIEETSELNVELGKVIMCHGRAEYYDGKNLYESIADELADSMAAMTFFATENGFDTAYITKRMQEKLALYDEWKQSNE